MCGDFNEWSPRSLPMVRHGEDHSWEKRLMLEPGRYEYKFIVNETGCQPRCRGKYAECLWLPQFRRGGPAMNAPLNPVRRKNAETLPAGPTQRRSKEQRPDAVKTPSS